MRKVLSKEEVGGSYVIDTIERIESSSNLLLFFVECKDWEKQKHLVRFVKTDNGYFIKDCTLGIMTKCNMELSELRTMEDFFNDIDIAEQNFSKGYGKKF